MGEDHSEGFIRQLKDVWDEMFHHLFLYCEHSNETVRDRPKNN